LNLYGMDYAPGQKNLESVQEGSCTWTGRILNLNGKDSDTGQERSWTWTGRILNMYGKDPAPGQKGSWAWTGRIVNLTWRILSLDRKAPQET
jgi:hypothetical protein